MLTNVLKDRTTGEVKGHAVILLGVALSLCQAVVRGRNTPTTSPHPSWAASKVLQPDELVISQQQPNHL